jgi:hypothetical protein
MQRILYAFLVFPLLVAFSLAQTPTPPEPSTSSDPSMGQPQVQTDAPAQPASPAQVAPAAQAGAATNASGPIGFAPGTVLLAELTKSIDAKKAKQGDPVEAKTAIDLTKNGQVVVPKGAKLVGHVADAKAKQKGESESTLTIAFDEMVTKDGQHVPMPAMIQAIRAWPQQANSPATAADTGSSGPAVASGGMAGGGGGMAGGAGRPVSTAPGQPGVSEYPNANTANTAGNASSSEAQAPLTGETQGIIGLPDLSLSNSNGSSVITSEKKNVKLESGTQLLLKVGKK